MTRWSSVAPPLRPVVIWLLVMELMIAAMVAIGGITRLTGSGLSMVEWHPLMGALPPLSDPEWLAVFEKYQATPQYQQVNHWMTLGDFKTIFFWEYLHRLFGRLIGIVFFVPWLVFMVKGHLTGSLRWRAGLAFVLGGLQGLLGWFMVKSGLVDQPQVSHFRLAAHLSLAFIVAIWIFWVLLDILQVKRPAQNPFHRTSRRLAWGIVALVGLQIVYGAFMAGTRAGYLYATFPDMHGEWLPATVAEAGTMGLVSHPASIHFLHRTLGWVAAFTITGAWLWARRSGSASPVRTGWTIMAGVVWAQFLLGAATVISHVAVPVAVIHQVGALILLATGVFVAHAARPARQPSPQPSVDLAQPAQQTV